MKRISNRCIGLSVFLLFSQCALLNGATQPASALPPSTPELAQPMTVPALPTVTSPPKSKRPEMPLEFFNFIKDCFVVNLADGQQQYAAWLPLQAFMRMYATAGGDTTQLEPKVNDLKPYLMFLVENRTCDQFKNPTSKTVESLRSRALLRLPDGTEVKPLDKTPDGMPTTPPTFGTLGRHAQLLIFPVEENADLDGEHSGKGKLQLVLKGNDSFKTSSFTWHLPLELSGAARQCTRCHNDISSKWSFCPYCGTKQKQ